jgi:hypothetical protein
MMKHLALVLAVPLFGSICVGQKYTVAPPEFASKEGGYSSYSFGVFAKQRLQWADGEIGSGLRILNGFGMRSTSKIKSSGRTFSNLTIQLADTDYKTVTSTFSVNATSTPTSVFSGPFTLPDITGSFSGPSPWDSRLAISFKTPFLYTGTKDLLIDMDFVGGRLSNGQSWSTPIAAYSLDTTIDEYSRWGQLRLHGRAGGNSGCMDRGSSLQTGAGSTMETIAWGPASANPAVQTALTIETQCYWTGPYALVTHVVSLYGSSVGFPVPGVTCNKVHIDLSKPAFLLFHKTDKNGRSWKVHPVGWKLPWNAAFTGLQLWYQAAWNDTVDGRLLLTNASENHVPGLRPSYKRVAVYQYDGRSVGYGPYPHASYFPILRYVH